MKKYIPQFVLSACDCLYKNGFEAYIVGGAVRDSLLQRVPNDWDIATNARPDDIEKVFADEDIATSPTGKQYGTITILMDQPIEVTTYRGHESYSSETLVCNDCNQIINSGDDECMCGCKAFRKAPRARIVKFGDTIHQDLMYRDFTINAIAYNPKDEKLIDIHESKSDIHKGVIKTIGRPSDRFGEDPLRMLRAVRLAVQLGFFIDATTKVGITNSNEMLKGISAERIRSEFDKILLTDKESIHQGIELLRRLLLLRHILPELLEGMGMHQCGSHIYDVYTHNVLACSEMPPILEWRLAGLLHDIGKPYVVSDDPETGRHFYQHEYVGEKKVEEIMTRLRYSRDQINFVKLLVRNHMWVYNDNSKLSVARRLIANVGMENLEALMAVRMADRKASGRKGAGGSITRLRAAIRTLNEQASAFKVTDLDIDGNDIINLGVKPGPKIGKLLKDLLDAVIEEEVQNNKTDLIEAAKSLIDKYCEKVGWTEV